MANFHNATKEKNKQIVNGYWIAERWMTVTILSALGLEYGE